jgi:hypothetical protein
VVLIRKAQNNLVFMAVYGIKYTVAIENGEKI